MKAFQVHISGNWAHFKKPETNNNPLTHDFITKTALVGLIGSVLGKTRDEMRPLFPKLCEDLLYGVEVLKAVKKESWGFTLRKAVNIMEKAPKQMEFLKNPKYLVTLALKSERSDQLFEEFKRAVKQGEAHYTPVLGLHNCPANLRFTSEGIISAPKERTFKSKGFVSEKHKINIQETKHLRVGLDRIPTYQNDDFWNPPERYVKVIYPSGGDNITVEGECYDYDQGEKMWLI